MGAIGEGIDCPYLDVDDVGTAGVAELSASASIGVGSGPGLGTINEHRLPLLQSNATYDGNRILTPGTIKE